MRGFRQCTLPLANGRDCWNEPDPDNKFGVCLPHWRNLASTWKTAEVRPDRIKCVFCELLSALPNGEGIAFCINPQCQMSFEVLKQATKEQFEAALAIAEALRAQGPVQIVYYITWGSRIKIGTTTNLEARLKNIYHDECAAVELGGYDLEARRHRQFESSRVPGQKEWFNPTPEMVSLINELRTANGPPLKAVARWNDEKKQGAA